MNNEAVVKDVTDVLLTDTYQRQNSRKRILSAIYHDKNDIKQSSGRLQEMRVEGSYHSDKQSSLTPKPQLNSLKPDLRWA